MSIKPYIILGVAVAVVLIGVILGVSVTKDSAVEPGIVVSDTARINPSENDEESRNTVPEDNLNAVTFSGTLEAVDTGCFADGECFVVVDGKHVTTIMGWSQETVGTVQGVEGFGDLESHIGEVVEVHARAKEDGTYTLYGSEKFYLKLLRSESFPGSGSDVEEQGDALQPAVADGCMVGGCSSQLCVDASLSGDLVTTCEYKAEYACYKTARCERQTNGQCGWTETSELFSCLVKETEEPTEIIQ